MEIIDLFNNGMPPILAGALDQSAWLMRAVRLARAEEARIKSET